MVSERRNELLAEMLQRVHLTEKWGRGIKLILSKEPGTIFKEIGSHFIAVLKRKTVGDVQSASTQKGTQKSNEKSNEKGNEKILTVIGNNQAITTRELARLSGLSLGGVEKIIRGLKQKGVLRRVGPDKGGHWEVTR